MFKMTRRSGGAGALEVAHDDGAEATVPGLDATDRRLDQLDRSCAPCRQRAEQVGRRMVRGVVHYAARAHA